MFYNIILLILDTNTALTKLMQLVLSSDVKSITNLVNYLPEDELVKKLNLADKTPANNTDSLFKWIETYLKYSLNTEHPYFNNRMWSSANIPSILGEIIVALKNTSNCTYESAPVASLMERYMIDEMLYIIGFKKGEGQMTTGSSNANMIAMMIARNQTITNAKEQGLFSHKPLFAFVSADAHYSFDKAANILGIGSDNLIKIASKNNGQIDIDKLEVSINEVIYNNGVPFFIGATLGTTVRGAFDNISELLIIKNKYKLWLHGDGAWGGACIMNDKLKTKFLTDVDKLDSFTMDFHKMLNSALMCNFLLLNYQGLLNCTCANGNTDYIFHKNIDIGVNSLQCGRRVDSLKWFLDWKFFTKTGFSDRVMNYYNLAIYAEKIINSNDNLNLVAPRESFNVCFNFIPNDTYDIEYINEFNLKLRDKLYKQELNLLSIAYIDKIFVFRLLIANPNMTKNDLDKLFINIMQQATNKEHCIGKSAKNLYV